MNSIRGYEKTIEASHSPRILITGGLVCSLLLWTFTSILSSCATGTSAKTSGHGNESAGYTDTKTEVSGESTTSTEKSSYADESSFENHEHEVSPSSEPPELAEKPSDKLAGGTTEDTKGMTKDSLTPSYPPPKKPQGSAGVKAGSSDDNLQFNAFLKFLEENGDQGLPCKVFKRIIVSVKDRDGLPLSDAKIVVSDGSRILLERRTYADGRALIFPSETEELQGQSVKLSVQYGAKSLDTFLNASGKHQLEVRLDLRRGVVQEIPLDIAFLFDTTGSMGDEIDRLKQTLDYINFQVSHLTPKPAVRLAMVLYRDRGDDYVTKIVPFTPDIGLFAQQLNQVQAGGGGDTPEDVQQGIEEAMKKLEWRESGVKLAFLIGDAPPHLDYNQEYTYVQGIQEAARKGIKIATIGASGLDRQGELVWRQIAQYTMAPFVFITYGEKGDSEGGSSSSVSHHVGSNWVAENLDAIIVRMVKVELSNFSPKGIEPLVDYFDASENPSIKSEDVLQDLFAQSIRQLVDYCVQKIESRTPTVVLPIKFNQAKLKTPAEKLETRLTLGLAQSGEFQLIERRDLPDVVQTLSSQYSQQYDGDKVAELGKILPAKLAVFSAIDESGSGKLEMIVKLVRLETGEILSLSLLKIEKGLVMAKN